MGCAAWGTGSPVPPFCFCPARMHMHARGQRAAVAGGSAYLNELERKALCTDREGASPLRHTLPVRPTNF